MDHYLGYVTVLDTRGLVQVLPLDPLRGQAAAGDGRPAPERLELGVCDPPVIVHLTRETHEHSTLAL